MLDRPSGARIPVLGSGSQGHLLEMQSLGPSLRDDFGKWFVFFFFFFRASPVAYGSFPARGQTAAAGLHHSHSHPRSKLYLRPQPQLVAKLDP